MGRRDSDSSCRNSGLWLRLEVTMKDLRFEDESLGPGNWVSRLSRLEPRGTLLGKGEVLGFGVWALGFGG